MLNMDLHRRISLALLLACWLLHSAAAHPNCVQAVDGNIFPPIPNPPLAYCSEYGANSEGACCTAASEITLAQNPAEKILDFASTDPQIATCAGYIKDITCTWCNPYSGHNYESENGVGHRQWPWLCTAFCTRLWTACANVPLNASGPISLGLSIRIPGLLDNMGVTTLAQLFADQNEFCEQYSTGNPGACFTDDPQELITIPGGASIPFTVELAYPNILFNAATLPLNDPSWYIHITHIIIAQGTNRIFTSFQHGVIVSWNDDEAADTFSVVADIQDSTYFDNGGGSEFGVMGVGFHPDFATNGWMFVKHSHLADHDRIVRYTVDRTTWIADPASALVILEYQMFGVMHHGAPPIFATDGMMYVANGDGTNYFDNGKNYNPARDQMSLLGKILRINVDASTPAQPYTVPADNPFVGNAAWAPEIWAYGFRNPWRFTYDGPSNRFWVGSVGQTKFEGIWVPERAKYHGWHSREAFNCYWPTASLPDAPFTDCVTAGEVLPLFEFPHVQSDCSIASDPAHCAFPAISGNAVIGGYVYRGTRNPSIFGTYIFANYQPNFEAWVYTLGFNPDDPHNVRFVWRLGFTFQDGHDPNNWSISTLGLDSLGELLIVNINNPNEILKLLPDNPPPSTTPVPGNNPDTSPIPSTAPNDNPATPDTPSTSPNPPAAPPTQTNVVPVGHATQSFSINALFITVSVLCAISLSNIW